MRMHQIEEPQYQSIIFVILILFMIPSILCSIFLFYQFIRLRILRTRINNHLILLLLFINFILVISFI